MNQCLIQHYTDLIQAHQSEGGDQESLYRRRHSIGPDLVIHRKTVRLSARIPFFQVKLE